ncbi:thioredoxin domain-containing protein [Ekhidna sp.]|uniref:thioredoxin domain-containing protein n=1 Tax=Ekhidna sp. TaxID=2608089 RepID=UPI003515ABA1
MKKIILIAFIVSCSVPEKQQTTTEEVKSGLSVPSISKKLLKPGWYEADTINFDQYVIEKPVLIFFWTTWCKGCKQAEEWYLKEENNYAELRKDYHLFKVNGDSAELTLKNMIYRPSSEQSFRHELVLECGNTWFGYPNILLFDKNLDAISPLNPQIYMGRASNKFLPKLDSVMNL